jgi:hypothetical protein
MAIELDHIFICSSAVRRTSSHVISNQRFSPGTFSVPFVGIFLRLEVGECKSATVYLSA